MNIDNKSRGCLATCTVVSEYFSKETLMDDSWSDFQKKKKFNTGPKTVQNKVSKPKKRLKKVKGQRDIRVLVKNKNKESELISYSKNFDQICKTSGIDVDSEQLQLAVALSKSLKESENNTDSNSQNTKPLISLNKTAKIRTTLQEYGFSVPNTKINKSRPRKQFKKHYKLLIVSEEERQQIISDRFAEILATNVHRSPVKDNNYNINDSQGVFYKSANISYEFMRNDDVFYVKDLFEKAVCKSNMLRDWSKIPGRPASPNREESDFKFENIACTLDDLDCILSGSIQAAQDIIKSKYFINNCYKMDIDKNLSPDNIVCVNEGTRNGLNKLGSISPSNNDLRSPIMRNNDLSSPKPSISEKINSAEADLFVDKAVVAQVRSTSPDLFDDEISLISDSDTKPIHVSNVEIKKDSKIIDFMDLTECVEIAPVSIYKSKLSLRERNETKRKSNDFMDITECVNTCDKQCSLHNIDLTQTCSNFKKENDCNKFKDQHLVLDATPSKVGCRRNENALKVTTTIKLDECFEVKPKAMNYKLNSKITSKADDIESYNLNKNAQISEVQHHSSLNDSNQVIDLTQSINDDDNILLTQTVAEKKDKSRQENVVIKDKIRSRKQNNYNEENADSESTFSDDDFQLSQYLDKEKKKSSHGTSIIVEDRIRSRSQNNSNKEKSNSQSIHSNDDFQLTQNVCTKKEKSTHETGVINEGRIISGSKNDSNEANALTESTHSDDDFQMSQNIVKKKKSIHGNVVVVDDVDFKLKDEHNGSKESLKSHVIVKKYSEFDYSEHKYNKLSSELCDETISKEKIDNNKTYIEIDLTQPLNFDNDQLENASDRKQINSLEDSVLIVEDIESTTKPIINKELLLEKNDIDVKEISFAESQENKEIISYNGNDTNKSPSYIYDEYVYNNSIVYDYYNENSLHMDDAKDKIAIENTSFDKNIHKTNESHTEQLNNNTTPPINDNNIEVIEDVCIEDDLDKIDLTQKSDSSNDFEFHNHIDTHNLGKKDNISIDYDEMFDDVMSIGSKHVSQTSNKSANNTNKEVLSNPSKTSDCFEISDKEFNYSLQQSRHNFDIGGLSTLDNASDFKMQSTNKSRHSGTKLNRSCSEGDLLLNNIKKITASTPLINKRLIKEVQQTPGNSEYIVKINNVTPMLDYESMSTPERNRELDKYGLKPFKRKRAIQLLKHVYDQTHPIVEACDTEECVSPCKKRKYNHGTKYYSPKKSPRKQLYANFEEANMENSLYVKTKENPDIREIKCLPDDWVFQKREKAKVHSCRVPLHIAFHNYVSCRKLLRESILRYEPVNIDVIHKDLVADGYKYNPKDLLRFMDKKCITVKTTDNNARNKRT